MFEENKMTGNKLFRVRDLEWIMQNYFNIVANALITLSQKSWSVLEKRDSVTVKKMVTIDFSFGWSERCKNQEQNGILDKNYNKL